MLEVIGMEVAAKQRTLPLYILCTIVGIIMSRKL